MTTLNLSGTIKDPTGSGVAAKIKAVTSVRGENDVLFKSSSEAETDENGAYSMTLVNGTHKIFLDFGFGYTLQGEVEITDTTNPSISSLSELLGA